MPSSTTLAERTVATSLAICSMSNLATLGSLANSASMAAPYIGILSTDELRSAVARVFQRKGDAIVEANLKAFDAGVASVV